MRAALPPRHCEEPLRRSNPESFNGESLDCFAALAMTLKEPDPYLQDSPASIVVQKPQWPGARMGACAWASNRKTARVKTTKAAENKAKRLRMGMRLIEIVVE